MNDAIISLYRWALTGYLLNEIAAEEEDCRLIYELCGEKGDPEAFDMLKRYYIGG